MGSRQMLSRYTSSLYFNQTTVLFCFIHQGAIYIFIYLKDSIIFKGTVQFSSVTQSCPTLCDPTEFSTPGFPVLHQLLELAQTHVHRVSDASQPSRLLSPSPPAFNLSQHQGLFQWVRISHQVAKVLELQLQHQSFQWIFRTDFL